MAQDITNGEIAARSALKVSAGAGMDRGRVVHVAGHELTVYAESSPLIDALVADIRTAKRRVSVESYIIAADAAGLAMAEALKERARAGVDCRLMYDAVGSAGTPAAFFTDLAEAGVHVHAFHTPWYALQRFAFFRTMNRRNHRKLTIIDDRIGYFGGMNIVDQSGIETVEQAKARRLPISAGWRDVHVRLVGPQQHELADAFDRLWRRVHHQRVKGWPRWPIHEMLACRDDALFFFDSRPTMKYRRPSRVFVPLIRQARRRITLSMAYFIPLGSVLRALVRARRRGVAVTVIIPGSSDVKLVQWATRHLYAKLLRRGIRIYERSEQMLHGKAMVIDDHWSVIGSCNLDPRSLRINLEFLAAIRSQELARAIHDLCDSELRNSRRVTLRDCRNRRWWQRLVDRGAWTVRRWL
jgi:cardiolipin synthase